MKNFELHILFYESRPAINRTGPRNETNHLLIRRKEILFSSSFENFPALNPGIRLSMGNFLARSTAKPDRFTASRHILGLGKKKKRKEYREEN